MTLPEDHVWTGAEIQELLDTQLRYKDWKFVIEEENAVRGGIMDIDLHLRVEWMAPDNITGVPELQQSRWWRLSKHMRKNEIIQTAFKCIKTAEEHEMRECFQYWYVDLAADGQGYWTIPFNPHTDVDSLAEASQHMDVRVDNRPQAPKNQRRD